MNIKRQITTTILVDGIPLSGDKFAVEFMDGSEKIFKHTDASSVIVHLESQGLMDGVTAIFEI